MLYISDAWRDDVDVATQVFLLVSYYKKWLIISLNVQIFTVWDEDSFFPEVNLSIQCPEGLKKQAGICIYNWNCLT